MSLFDREGTNVVSQDYTFHVCKSTRVPTIRQTCRHPHGASSVFSLHSVCLFSIVNSSMENLDLNAPIRMRSSWQTSKKYNSIDTRLYQETLPDSKNGTWEFDSQERVSGYPSMWIFASHNSSHNQIKNDTLKMFVQLPQPTETLRCGRSAHSVTHRPQEIWKQSLCVTVIDCCCSNHKCNCSEMLTECFVSPSKLLGQLACLFSIKNYYKVKSRKHLSSHQIYRLTRKTNYCVFFMSVTEVIFKMVTFHMFV